MGLIIKGPPSQGHHRFPYGVFLDGHGFQPKYPLHLQPTDAKKVIAGNDMTAEATVGAFFCWAGQEFSRKFGREKRICQFLLCLFFEWNLCC